MALLRKLADGLIGLSAFVGGLCLLGLVGVILVDVVGRAFGAPLFGSQDLINMGMAILVFGGMALCDRNGGHIAVDLLEPKFPHAMNRAIDIIAAFAGAVIFIMIAYTLFESAKLSQMLNMSTNLLRLPRAWFQWGVSVLSIITALGMALRGLELILSGKDVRKETT
jgi:TRAP-type C4-dicarboxylate transport system permease small subunit